MWNSAVFWVKQNDEMAMCSSHSIRGTHLPHIIFREWEMVSLYVVNVSTKILGIIHKKPDMQWNTLIVSVFGKFTTIILLIRPWIPSHFVWSSVSLNTTSPSYHIIYSVPWIQCGRFLCVCVENRMPSSWQCVWMKSNEQQMNRWHTLSNSRIA